VVYDNEVTLVLVHLLIPTLPERLCGCKCLIASSAALVHVVHPQLQKTYQWKNDPEDTSRFLLSAYDMIRKL
jgi:hypothetical protein